MAAARMVKYASAFKRIEINNKSLQLFDCWCVEAGLTCFRNCFTALAEWMGGTDDGVAAVYLLPTARDAGIANAHLESDRELAHLVTRTSPEPRRVLVESCQQWVNEGLVSKTLALQHVVIVVDLGVGTVSSHVSAMAVALFTELQPRDRSTLRTLSIMVLQQLPMPKTAGSYLFDHLVVNLAVSRKGWELVRTNARTGSLPDVSYSPWPPGCRPTDAEFDETQFRNSLAILKRAYGKAEADRRADEAFKAIVLMNRDRFRRLAGAAAPARAFFIHDRTPAKVVQAICEGEEPGLTLVGITTTELCFLPRVRGLQLLIADSTAEAPQFDVEIGHSVTRETDAVLKRRPHMIEISSEATDLATIILWDGDTHLPDNTVFFPSHHTGEMFHLIIRLAEICPGQRLQEIPCLTLPDKFPVLIERVRRLSLWGIIKQVGAGVGLTERKGRLISRLARHEANIHALVLLAGAADPPPGLSAQARHLLVWLAVVVAHDPQCVLADTQEQRQAPATRGPAGIVNQKGSIWAAVLGAQAFARSSNTAGAEPQESQGPAVEPAEARQVVDSVAFWAEKLSLPAIHPPVPSVEDLQPHEMGQVEQQLVGAFIYNIASYDMDNGELTDLLSDAELCDHDDDVMELVMAAGKRDKQVFAVYTDLYGSGQRIIPRSLTGVSHKAVFAELVKIAPRPKDQPGTSPIDLSILRPRTAPPTRLVPAPVPPQADLLRGQGRLSKTK